MECGTDLADGVVDAAFCVEINIAAPYPLNNFFPRDEVSRIFREQDEEFQGLAFETHSVTGATQLKLSGLELKLPET